MRLFNLKSTKNLVFLLGVVLLVQACKKDDPDPTNVEVNAIDAYLAANVTDLKLYDQSGIRIVVHQYGQNPPVQPGQNIKFTYTGKLFSTGDVFASGIFNDQVEKVLPPGLAYGIPVLLSGSSATIYVPSMYGYGSAGTTGVPANSTLVYEVTVDEVTKTSAQQTQFNADTAAVHQYIKSNSIQNVVKLPCGVWYSIDIPTSDVMPTVYSSVTMQYTGMFLSGDVFDQNTLQSQRIFDLIDGLKVGMPEMRVGSTYTFYIPSLYGYGATASKTIPANSNLIFKVKLVGITGQ